MRQAPVVAFHFEVIIDTFDLGTWSKCEGLKVDFKSIKALSPSGDHFSLFSGRTEYSNITLSRPVTLTSKGLALWLSALRRMPVKGTGVIALKDGSPVPVMSWELSGVLPVTWQGPTLDASSAGVATEQLVLAHEGFL